MTIEHAAELIGAYAPLILLLLISLIAGGIILAWRYIDRHGVQLRRRARAARQCFGRAPVISALRIRYPWAWHFTHRRLDPGTYLGLHLTVGLMLLVGSLLVFGEFAEEIWEDEAVTRFDRALVIALQEHTSVTVMKAFAFITRIGDVSTIIVLGLVVSLFLLLRRDRLLVMGWLVTLIGGGVLNWVLKELLQRARPELIDPFITASGWSFPSGHAMGSLMAYGMLAYVLLRLGRPEWRLPVIVITVTLVLLIGTSRLFLQVHYFSDVLAGFAAGTAWLAICITGTELALRRKTRQAPDASSR